MTVLPIDVTHRITWREVGAALMPVQLAAVVAALLWPVHGALAVVGAVVASVAYTVARQRFWEGRDGRNVKER